MADKLQELMERMEERWARVERYMQQGPAEMAAGQPGGASIDQVMERLNQLRAGQDSLQKQLLALEKRLGAVERRLEMPAGRDQPEGSARGERSLTDRLNELQAEIDRLARPRG